MKVRFDFTLDDLVDASQRGLTRSGTIRRLRLQGMLMIALLGGGLVFLLRSGSLEGRLFYAAIGAAVCAALYPMLSRGTREKTLKKVFRERFGGDGPWSCEIELLPSAVVSQQAGARHEVAWSKFVSVEDAADAVELVGRGAGTIVVRNRAFTTPQERSRFIELAREYLAAAKR